MSFSCACERLLMGVVLCVFLGLFSEDLEARTWHVPSEVGMIYQAVDSASYGDTVLVAPGTYYRERDKPRETGVYVWLWLKDGVTITSEEGPGTTVLGDLVTHIANNTVYGYEVTAATFSGFTIYTGFGKSVLSSAHDKSILIERSDAII